MENGFFKWLWRFNGIVIAIGSILLLGLIAWEMSSSWRRTTFPTRTTDVLEVTPQAEVEASAPEPSNIRAYFGSPNRSTVSGLYILPRYVEQEYQNRGISKSSGGNLTNYLIIKSEAQTKNWLFEGQTRLITETHPIYQRFESGQTRLLGNFLTVVETDTNNDDRLSSRDLAVMYFVAPDWSEPTLVFENVKSIITVATLSESLVDVLFYSGKGAQLATLSLPGAQILKQMNFSTAD